MIGALPAPLPKAGKAADGWIYGRKLAFRVIPSHEKDGQCAQGRRLIHRLGIQ